MSKPTPKDYYVRYLTPQFKKKWNFYSYSVHIIGSFLSNSLSTVLGRSVLIVRVFSVQSTPTFSVKLDSKHRMATLLGDLCACSNDFRHVMPIHVTPEAF